MATRNVEIETISSGVVPSMAISEREVEAWGIWLRAAGRPESTIGLRTYHVRRVMTGVGTDPWSLTTEDLVMFLACTGWAAETRRSYRASLRSFYTWAQATGRRTDSPAALLPPVKVPRRVPRPTPDVFYREALLVADDRQRLMIHLAAICGLRRGEIARVRREDVVPDLIGHSLRVLGKGGHERLVPMPAELARTVLALPVGWVFPSPKAGHLTPHHVGKLVSRCLPEGWTTHTLRHRCATVAYASTRDLRAVQELLGHAKPETTALYTQVPKDAVRAAVMAAAA
jgi:integrase/recombinase XerC